MATSVAEPSTEPSIGTGPDPARVAAHQRELREQGYTIMPRLIDDRQLAQLRAAIDARLAGKIGIDDNPDNYGETNLVAKAPIFRELAQQPLVLATVEGLLGDDCILSSCNQGSRKPGGAAQGLHRDMNIWGPSMPWLEVPIGVQVAWCVDEFTAENGATLIVPGSHARADASGDEPSIPAVAPAGSMILFDARTFHAGGANRSQALRRAVLCFYIRSWLKPQTDHKRSIEPALVQEASATMIRLLGFQRQSPVELADGRTPIVPAPGATWFYGETRTDAQ